MILEADFGYVFVYVTAFGFSDLIVKHYIPDNMDKIIYYSVIGLFGASIVIYDKKIKPYYRDRIQ